MRGIGKAIGAGIAIIIVGIIVFVVALGLNDWKLESFGNFEVKDYESVSQINTVKLNSAIGTVKTEFYDGDKILVKYPENNKLTTTVTEENGVLTATTNVSRHWWMSFGFTLKKIPVTVISIPQNSVVNLDFQVNAGTVTVADGKYDSVKIELNAGTIKFGNTICQNLKCNVNAGTLKIDGVSCDKIICKINAGTVSLSGVQCDDIDVGISAGSATINVKGNKTEYNIYTDVSAGSCNIKSQSGTVANKTIKVDVSAGSVNVNFN